MPTPVRIPPPRNWQDFERLSADLWRRIWNDPCVQANGRQGQPQHGVDIFGRIAGTDSYVGVQCKGKDHDYGRILTISELRREVAKAKQFVPPLTHFIVAATAPNDASIQTEARLITREHLRGGLFTVDVLGWDEIELRLGDYPELISKYFPSLVRRRLPGFDAIDVNVDLGEANPKKFFLGWKPTFADLKADVDVRRTVRVDGTDLSYDTIRHRLIDLASSNHLYIVFGEGGSGKTTFLRRLALDLAVAGLRVYRALLGAQLSVAHIVEDAKLYADTPTVLVIDDAPTVGHQLFSLNEELQAFPNRTVVVAASRRNEWNVRVGAGHDPSFQALYLALLSQAEAEALIERLTRTNALGRLAALSAEDRLESLMVGARRQLLAGLLEATHGLGFQTIVRNEYESITHDGARFLYLASCLLQRFGIFLPFVAGRALSAADTHIAFENDVLSHLELVVQLEDSEIGRVILPRHRSVSHELLLQICRTREEQLDLALRLLHRLRGWTRFARSVQPFAARIGERMLHRRTIQTEEDAYAVVEAILAAGTKNYRIGRPTSRHTLRLQAFSRISRGTRMYQVPSGHPCERQFMVAVEISRSRITADEAIRIATEGLSLNGEWRSLLRARAQTKFEKGEIESAEADILRLLQLGSGKGPRQVRLPVPFAMALMKLRRTDDPPQALKYLELANEACHSGMADDEGYFLARAGLLVVLGRPLEAISLLERGRAHVAEPKSMVHAIAREYTALLVTHDAHRFCQSTMKHVAGGGVLGSASWRLLGNIGVMRRDAAVIRIIIERHPNPFALIVDLTEDALRKDDPAGVDFVRRIFSSTVTAESNLHQHVFAGSVEKRDEVAFRAVLERVADAAVIVRALIEHYGREGDLSAQEFVRHLAARDGLLA